MNRPLESELQASIDDRLSAERAAEVAAWLSANPEEAARVAAGRGQRELLHSAFDSVLDETPPQRLIAAAQAAPRRMSWRAAAAIAWIALGFSGGYFLKSQESAPEAPAIAHRAAIAHAIYVPEVRHPVEVGADQEAHLVQWLSKRLGKPLKLPRLAGAGFDLVGGRLLPGETGPVAQFMYQDTSGRRLTLYIGTDHDNRDTAFRFAQEGKLAVFYWLDGNFGYALSGEMPREEMLKLAEAAYRDMNP